jgi:sulfite reductase (NADPH) hemoprotein beta-component
MRAIADLDVCDFVMTANQNLILANISARNKAKVEKVLADHGVAPKSLSGARRNSIACVALPTCALALAESERYLPHFLTKFESILDKAGLKDEEIVVRMTGCPNGCGRPYLGEIGFVGRSPGLYNLYLGAAFDGARMNKLYAQDVDEERALKLLEPIVQHYAKDREKGEHFGDFTIRAGYVKPTLVSNQFHNDVKLA